MKNSSSLYILKPILTFLIGLILVLSCSQEETNPDLPVGVPGPNGSEAVVKLLIKGEAILPPSTRNMSDQTEGSYQDEFQLLILEKQADDNTYIYNCHRPVEGTQGNFTVKVPNSLDGKELKFLLFSNSKDIIGDPDQKFVVTDGTNKNEDYIRTALLLTVNTKWDSSKNIPMWAEDSFTFRVPTPGAAATPVATLKLMRMLARVDVGLNYNGKELNSTAQELTNFKLQKIKVYHSKDKGQLIPNTAAYETTGTGADKVITIKTPSIPADGTIITPYEITVPDGSHASERDVYLFEQDMNLSQADFDVNRTCILVQGEYTAPAPAAGGTGTTYTGWYRLDFRDFGSDKGYADILRNKLYRFNITAVKGSGFATESDALNSVSSNITVELLAMDLNQNDIIFDGQSFLSVSGSELYFYQDRNTAGFSLTTNYGNGWKIETNGNGITATPAEGAMGSSVVDLTWNPLPTGAEQKEIYLTAGNLKKKLILKYVHETAPGDLTNFTLDPPFLYFAKTGGTGKINIVSNIAKKYLSATLGNLNFTVPPETEGNSFDVTVNPFTATSTQHVEQGVVNVHVRAANADVKGQSIINQLTYDKDLDCAHPGRMEHGVGSAASFAYLDVPYTTTEVAGTYLISFIPGDGGIESGPDPSRPENGQGIVQIAARPNKTSTERTVGKLLFMPAEDGKEISLIGYTPKELTIKQEPVPPPAVTITPDGGITDLEWNQEKHSFMVTVDNPAFVENNNVAISLSPKSRTIDMGVSPTGELGTPVPITMVPNRGETPRTRTVGVSVDGHGDHVGTGQVTFTQKAPGGITTDPVVTPIAKLPWNATAATLELTQLDNIYEVKVLSKEAVGSEPSMTVDTGNGNFTMMGPNKTSATLAVTFDPSKEEVDRKVKITAQAIGNRESETKNAEFTLIQEGLQKGIMSFAQTNVPIDSPNTNGNVLVNTERIEKTNIEPFVDGFTPEGSSPPADTWITFNYAPGTSRLQYAALPNKGKARSVTFNLRAKDIVGRDVLSTNKLTLTQQAGPSGSMKFTGIGEAAQDPVPVPYGGGTREWNVEMQNIDLSTLNIEAMGLGSVVESARFNGNRNKFTVVLKPNRNAGGKEIWTNVTVNAKDYHETLFSKPISFKIAENPVIPIVRPITLNSGNPAHGSETAFEMDIPVEAHSKDVSSASIHSVDNPSFISKDKSFIIPLSNRRGGRFKAVVSANNNTYATRTANVIIGWKATGQSQVITTRHTVTQAGHAPIRFNILSGSLPEFNGVHVKNTSTFTATVNVENLHQFSYGLTLVLNGISGPVGARAEWVNAAGNVIGSPSGKGEVTLRVRLTTPNASTRNPWVGSVTIQGTGVDGRKYSLREMNFK